MNGIYCSIILVLCLLGDVMCLGTIYARNATQSLTADKPISVSPSGATCSDEILYYKASMYQYEYASDYETETTEIQCSADICPNPYPREHITQELIGPIAQDIGYPGCTEIPTLLRGSQTNNNGMEYTTRGYPDTGVGPMRIRREANTRSICGLQKDIEYDFSVSNTYTMSIRPDQLHTRGTILSAPNEGGFDLNLENGALTIRTRYDSRSYPKHIIPTGVWTHVALQVTSMRDGPISITIFVNGEMFPSPLVFVLPSRKRRTTRRKRVVAMGEDSFNLKTAFIGISGIPEFNGHRCGVSAVERCQAIGYSTHTVVRPNTTIEVMEEQARAKLDQYKDLCPENSRVRDLLICGIYLPQCSATGTERKPCKSFCEEFKKVCPNRAGLQCLATSNRDCFNFPYMPEFGSFIGSIKQATYHEGHITAREITQLYNGTLPKVSPKSSCLCPDPGTVITSPLICSTANTNAYQAPIYRLGEYHRVPEAINDRLVEGEYISRTNWYSTDELDSAVITIELGERFMVYNLTYQLPSDREGLFAETTTIQLRDADSGAWKTIGYLAHNKSCSSLSPIISTQGLLTLTQPSCVNIQLYFDQVELNFILDRIGANEGDHFIMHPTIQYHLSGTAVRFILDKHEDESLSFYGIANIVVHGWRMNEKTCTCYGTGSGPTCDKEGRCECRPGAGDPAATGYTCYPYVRDDNDTSSRAVAPPYGPESGGTDVYIFGGFFGTENDTVTVSIGNIECTIMERSERIIHCLTMNVTGKLHLYTALPIKLTLTSQGRGSRPVIMILDETFMFKEDPVVETIQPLSTFLRGGVRQTVIGKNLDSVFAPSMNITIVYVKDGKSTLFPQKEPAYCTVINSTHMLCPAPNINNLPADQRKLLDTEEESSRRRRAIESSAADANERHRHKRELQFGLVNKPYLEFYVGLRLDGVKKYQNVSDSLPEYGRIRVYENPKIYSWERNGKELVRTFSVYKGGRFITIEGLNMLFGCTKEDYTVSIGKNSCTVDTVYSSQLLCFPPPSKPEVGLIHIDGAPVVTLTVGNINQLIGYLKYEETALDNPGVRAAVISVIVIFILVIIAVILAVVFIKKRRRRQTKEREEAMNKYTKPTNLWAALPADTKAELEPCMKKSESLKLGRKLGEGNFGTVFIGRFDDEKKETILVAAKTVKEKGLTGDALIEFLEEATLMKDFHHDNVLHLVGVVLQEGKPYVLLPLMEHGDLRNYLLSPNRTFTVGDLLDFGQQVASGMQYLSGLKFIHRDLAARNCMVDKDKKVKVADFGLARDIYSNEYYRVENKSRPLPIKWMALEALDDHKFTTRSDVWSYGVLLWELLTRGKRPYAHVDNFDLKNYLKRGNRLEKPDAAPDEVFEMMLQCWHMNPSSRPDFSGIVKELESILKEEDDIQNATSSVEDTTSPVGYQHLSRYVEYGTDRQGYEDLHETQGYLDMQGQVDYVQAARELGVVVDDSVSPTSDGYLAPIDSRPSSFGSHTKPSPAPRKHAGKASVAAYENLAAIQNQLNAEGNVKSTYDNSSPAQRRRQESNVEGSVRQENIELVEVPAPDDKDIGGVSVYQNDHDVEYVPDYLPMK